MEKVYKKIELVGVSNKSYEDAIKNAVEKAAATIHGAIQTGSLATTFTASQGLLLET